MAPTTTTPTPALRLAGRLVTSADQGDTAQLDATLTAAFLVYPPPQVIEQVIIPSLVRLSGAPRRRVLDALHRN
jgi:hypothetical protein